MENVAPCPGDDSTAAAPPWASATARTIASPSPEPSLAGSRRTPGSKMRTWSSTGMPPPESVTVTITVLASARAPTSTSPSGPAADTAFSIRLSTACRNRTRSPCTCGRSRSSSVRTRAPPRVALRAASRTTFATSTSSRRREPRSASASIRSILRHAASERSTSVRNEASSSPPILTAPTIAASAAVGAAHLVHHECQLLGLIRRRHVVRAAMRSSAQAAVSLSIGSCPEACV